MISIKDIAEVCGVSTATVSKALNNRDDVNPATGERVREAAKRLGYMPNAMARALKTKKTYNIGVLMVDLASSGLKHHYFASILDSFKVVMERSGYDLTFISNQVGQNACSYYEHCLYRNVDGLLVACVDFNTPEVQCLLNSELPIVSIDYIAALDGSRTDSADKFAVLSDNAEGIRDAVQFALRNGHSRIAYIYGDDTQVTQVRVKAFREVLTEHHCEVREDFLRQAKYLQPDLSYELTQALLSENDPENRPTCILYPDDICAVAGITAIGDSGLTVGKEVSVIGYDGHPVLRMLRPNLTTVQQNTGEIGREAAELMLQILRKEKIPPDKSIRYCKGTLLKGETVAPPTGC
jgi:DNA-binding LacI/PurR family transcriptional regulator